MEREKRQSGRPVRADYLDKIDRYDILPFQFTIFTPKVRPRPPRFFSPSCQIAHCAQEPSKFRPLPHPTPPRPVGLTLFPPPYPFRGWLSCPPPHRHTTPKSNMVSLRHIHKMTSYTHFELLRYCGPLSTSSGNLSRGLTPNLQSPLDRSSHVLPAPTSSFALHISLISLSQHSLFAPFLRCSTQGPGPYGCQDAQEPSTSVPNPPACRPDAFPTTPPFRRWLSASASPPHNPIHRWQLDEKTHCSFTQPLTRKIHVYEHSLRQSRIPLVE